MESNNKYYWDTSKYKKSTSINYHYDKNFFDDPLICNDFYIFQIGKYHGTTSTLIDTHIHKNFFELTIITDGEGTIITNNYPIKVKKGDIYLSLPLDSHKIESDSQNVLDIYLLSFATENERFVKELDNISMSHNAPQKRIISDEKINWLIGNAISELDNKSDFHKELLFSIFTQILIYVIQNFQKHTPQKTSYKVSHAEKLSYDLINYIDTHIFSIKSLDDLSKVTGYSYGYLSNIFRKTTNQSLSSYFQKKKMSVAEILLLENELNISEIAAKLNYSSVYAFSKAFLNYFKVSPSEYRNSLKKAEKKH